MIDPWRYTKPASAMLHFLQTQLERPDLTKKVKSFKLGSAMGPVLPFVPGMMVDLTTEKTEIFDACYSKALVSALFGPFLSSKINHDLYSAAVVQSVWQMTALTELDLMLTIHGSIRGD